MPLPKQVFAHGWLLFENDKMSKSRGNIVRSEPIRQVMGADALRYFLLREIVFGQDGSFSYDALIGRYNSDLANGLGNLASRTLTMIHQYRGDEIPEGSDPEIAALANETVAAVQKYFDAFEFSKGLEAVWALISAVDKYIVQKAPWKLARQNDQASQTELSTTLYTAAESLRIATALLSPVLPQSAPKIWAQLGMPESIDAVRFETLEWGTLQPGQKIGEIAGVFPRIELKEAVATMRALEETVTAEQNLLLGKKPRRRWNRAGDKIAIDDFAKVDLRVGLVKFAERVKGSDKLMHMKVDIGEARAAHHRGRHRRGLYAGATAQPQSGDRGEFATAQAERHRIERDDRGGIGGRRQARPGRLPRRDPRGSALEVRLVDSHCHLDDEKFDPDRAQVIERALAAGVELMMAIGTGGDLDVAIQQAERYPFIYATIGVHPHDAAKATPTPSNACAIWPAIRKCWRSARSAWTITTISRRAMCSAPCSSASWKSPPSSTSPS